MSYIRSKNIKGNRYLYEQASRRAGTQVRTEHIRYIGGAGTNNPEPPPTTYKDEDTSLIAKAKKELYKDPETRHALRAEYRLAERGINTQSIYRDPTTGKYNQQRQAIHQEILKEYDEEGEIVKGQRPTVIFLAGPPGSGKTTTLLQDIDKEKYVVLDSDAIKKKLPEYRGYNAGYLHEESTDIYEEAMRRAIKKNKNIILDATLKNPQKAVKNIERFKGLGYNVELRGTNLSKEEALNRAMKRFKEHGRYVPAEYIIKYTEPINKSVREVAPKADKWRVVDTGVPKGSPPKVISEGEAPPTPPANYSSHRNPFSSDAFHLPVRTAIIVPSTGDVDKKVGRAEYARRVEETSRFLAKVNGGYTMVRARGGYVSDDGRLVEEPVTEVVSFSEAENFEVRKREIERFLQSRGRRWGQESMGYEVEDDLFYVNSN